MNGDSKITVYLATKTGSIDNAILRIIKDNHGGSPRIKIVRSQRVFATDKGFPTLVEQFKNTGIVYAIKNELTEQAFETAVLAKLPFGVLFKNKDKKWESFRVRASVNR